VLQAELNTRVASLLIDLEGQLRQLNLWEKHSPSEKALASVEPFCVDTLTLVQWLQFVFLPRMYQLLEQQQALPSSCTITPMLQTYLAEVNVSSTDLVAIVEQLDNLLTR
jgi:uncharacterized protein YqcC (DUF446 family)